MSSLAVIALFMIKSGEAKPATDRDYEFVNCVRLNNHVLHVLH